MKGEMNEMENGGVGGHGKMGGMKGMKGKGKMKGGCKGHGKGMKGMGKGRHGMHGMEEPKKGYAYVREVETGFDETVARVKEELKKEGFGVLSEVRVDRLFKEKLDLDMEPYVILGACNPKFSSQLIGIDINSGTFLPCNLVVYVKDGKTYVSLLLPTKAMSITGNDELLEVAAKVEEILKGVVDRV
ncbi:DUF302 domain-containing protein [Thermococcus barophilus]|uniref:DUF302 domain-containing protein n=1 Tax=Thermococcus barophilus (strain DSM 11836 / MP) TaxID=391623 RepID=F0LHX3_THEBM|nr:DUF302 domain-containing protein [Thermococcus barophilus]ADT84373.1 hypothetical protein TERMP_01398 [Thermococcus barophilus MP]